MPKQDDSHPWKDGLPLKKKRKTKEAKQPTREQRRRRAQELRGTPLARDIEASVKRRLEETDDDSE